MISRIRPAVVPILFVLILIKLTCSGFFSVYWLKDNQWALDPNDLNIQWLSHEDYRAIETSTSSEFKMGGSTLHLPTDPAGRKALLSHYQLGTPDGRWHGRASTKLEGHTLQTWLGVALPTFVVCVIGLVVTRQRSEKPSSPELECEPYATV